jgi:alkanesulfonate monooxygenase SsuD/methylene tetrahydromethanopterin reductase-like flavin-dependent oxidoreductase (luciferase family)
MRPEFGLAIDFARPADPGEDRTAQIRTLIQLAEASGFQSVWAGEQYAADAERIHLPAPFVLLASLIPQTRLKLGTGVIVLPAYHPLRLAYETALLDNLSDGRLIVGAGVGNPVLARRFGVDPARIADVSDDALGAMQALWAGETSFQGKTVTLEGGIQPLPVQAGGPPLWVGGRIRRAVKRAARYGTGWFAGMHFSYENIVKQTAAYREELAALGKDTERPTVAVNRLLVLAASEAEARAAGGRAIDAPDPAATVSHQLVGTPDAVAASIRTYTEAGVTNMQLRVFPAGMSFEHAVRTLTLFRDEVLPQIE